MQIGDFEIDEDAQRIILQTVALSFIGPGMDGWELAEAPGELGEETTEFEHEGIDSPAWSCVVPVLDDAVSMVLRVVLETGLADASTIVNVLPLAEFPAAQVYVRDHELAVINRQKLHELLGPNGDSMRVVRAAQIIVDSGWSPFELHQGTPKDVEDYYQALRGAHLRFL